MMNWWLIIEHSRENSSSQCGLKTISLASAPGDTFAAQVKSVVGSLPSQLAVPGQPSHTLQWFVIDDRPT
ncbi:hypothetical protein [Paraburkholderia mimosarum]|uniref:hypothetical protein n=1 Tax=Paraburkholderia mimosarum TaxID=312026 RepID=UPI0012DBCE64|nr:hypothetical protein [Paraburkholderia mimosarum]